jgi:hypothetical protein
VKRGSAPIKKNIAVTDEQGNHYEATYPKRAKGLVKHGRARFIGADTICLACPPNSLEENNMSDKNTPKTEQTAEKTEFTMEWVLNRIESIINDTEHIRNTMHGTTNTAVGDAVQAREETNRRLIDLLGRMYDDLKPEHMKPQKLHLNLEQLTELARHLPPDHLERFVSKLT